MNRPTIEVLVVTSRGGASRAAALAALAAAGGARATVVGHTGPLPAPTRYDAVVVDGPWDAPDPAWLAGLRHRVAAGASLLAIGPATDPAWEGLAAAPDGPGMPPGELFARAADPRHPLLLRVAAEFPVVDRLAPLAGPPDATALLTVSVAFRDRTAAVEWTPGAGRVVASGLGVDDAALGSIPLRTVLGRGLRPRAEAHHPDRTLGVGVLGYGPYGGMGYYHGLACRSTPGLELVAAADTSLERRKAAEDEFPGIRTYADLAELAGDDDLDVAVVATPPSLHFDAVRSLLRAGKHVACEKPLCLTVAEVDELAATAVEAGVCLTVNQNRRWDPDFVALRRAVDAGMLGELFNVETFVGGFEHPCRAWHSEVSVSGGAVYDWGSHHVDWILQLMGGPPAVVQTFGHKRVWHDVTNLDQLRLRMYWDDGREAEFLQSDVAGVRRPKFYVQGTAGTLVGSYRPVTFERIEPGHGYRAEVAHHAEAPAELVLARYESGYGLVESRLPAAPAQPFAFHRNLADHLLLGEPLAVSVDSVRPVIAVLEASQRSSDAAGRAVPLASG